MFHVKQRAVIMPNFLLKRHEFRWSSEVIHKLMKLLAKQ